MAVFDWRQRPENLRDRYTRDTPGFPQWDRLLMLIMDSLGAATEPGQRSGVMRAFDQFMTSLDEAAPAGPAVCRVFVSHKQQDVAYAERVAWLADQRGFEYWLDVHDPALNLFTVLPLPPVVQSILVASIIEMALLNCTHLVAIQTAKAAQSRWVPYEYGRSKRRWVISTQVASWFDTGVTPEPADYLRLGVCAHSEAAVDRWLTGERGRVGCPPGGSVWRGAPPPALPN